MFLLYIIAVLLCCSVAVIIYLLTKVTWKGKGLFHLNCVESMITGSRVRA